MWDKLLKLLGFRKSTAIRIEIVPGVNALKFYKKLRQEYYKMDYTVGFCEILSRMNRKEMYPEYISLRRCSMLIKEFSECYPEEFSNWILGKSVFWFVEPEGWDIRMELIQGVIDKLEKEE